MRARVLACLVALLALAAAPGRSQQPDQDAAPQPTFRTGVGLVRVDVTATDGRGRAVTDLSQDEIEIREDGVVQRIQTFQFLRTAAQPSPDEDLAAPIRSPEHAAREAARTDVRLLVIFLDDYHLRFGPLYDVRLRQMLRRFVEVEMRPSDLFAVMGPLTPISDLGLTRDRQAILDRIEGFQGRLGGFVPPRSPLEESQSYLGGPQRMRVRAQITLSALKSLAEYLGSLREGRTSVLFVSEGPPLMVDGSSMSIDLREVIAAANRSNVTIHTLDPRELGAARFTSASNDALSGDTGGRRLANSNDYSQGLRAVLADASAYYLLGYEPPRPPADGRFHKIDVKVLRRGVRVLARRGYWAPKPDDLRTAAAAVPHPPEITEALATLVEPPRERPLDEWVGLTPLDAGRSLVTLAFAASASRAGRPAAGARDLSVAALAVELVGADGTPAQPVPTERGAGRWTARATLPSGAHRLRVLAANAAGEPVESWTVAVTVPPPDDPSSRLGTPVVLRAATPAAFKALSDPAAAPALERRFQRTNRVVVRLPLSADAGMPELKAELVNRKGQVLVSLPVAPAATGGAVQVELPLANLAQGDYVLRFTAIWGEARAVQHVAFAVVS